MNRSVNIFVGVILCAVLCGMFVWLSKTSETDTWNPNDIYDEVHNADIGGSSFTNASVATSSSEGGLALTMSSSSVFRHRSASLYAGATSSSISLPSLQGGAGGRLSSGGGLYTTSSAEIKSFGGGSNGGASMGGGAVRGVSSSNGHIASSPISYISSSNGLLGSSPAGLSSSELAMMSAENPSVDIASAANYDYTAFGNPAAGFYNAYTSGSYGSYGNYGGPSGIRGRQNTTVADSWQIWLLNNWLPNNSNWGKQGEDGNWYITQDDLRDAYNAFYAQWNETLGPAPTWEDWLAWFNPYGYGDGLTLGDSTYFWVPVGNILPLLLMILLYIAYIAIKSRKASLSSERSE